MTAASLKRINSVAHQGLKSITHRGSTSSARAIMHANIPLNTNDGDIKRKKDNREIAEIFNISPTTVNQIRKTYATLGLEASLKRKTRISPPTLSKITGDFEAQVIATALSPAPEASIFIFTEPLVGSACCGSKLKKKD